MVTVLFLLAMFGDDAPKALALPTPPLTATARPARCENARDQLARVEDVPAPALRPLDKEPLANAYLPVVRTAQCDRPVMIAKGVGKQQR